MTIVSRRGREPKGVDKPEPESEDAKEYGDYGMPLPTNDDEDHEYFFDQAGLQIRQFIAAFGVPYFNQPDAQALPNLGMIVSRATIIRAIGLDDLTFDDGSEDTRL